MNKNNKINIMQLVPSLRVGGAENQVVTLANSLDKTKFNVILCILQKGGPLLRQVSKDVSVIEIKYRQRYFPFALMKLIWILKKYKVHILHCHLYFSGFWGRIAGLIARVPVMITTEHGKTLWKKKHHIWFERWIDKFTAMRIAVSEDIKKIRIEREKLSPQKIVVIPNAIDINKFKKTKKEIQLKKREFNLDTNTFIIGTVGRLVEAKDLFTLLDAVAILKQNMDNFKVLIVGDGVLRHALQNYAHKLHIMDKIIFTGSREDIPDLLAMFDVFVLSSIREGIPVALLEAMASKKAIIATKVGGIPEVLEDNKSGILIPPRHPDILVEKIMYLFNNLNERERLGLNAYIRVEEKYGINKVIKNIEQLYEDLARRFLHEKR